MNLFLLLSVQEEPRKYYMRMVSTHITMTIDPARITRSGRNYSSIVQDHTLDDAKSSAIQGSKSVNPYSNMTSGIVNPTRITRLGRTYPSIIQGHTPNDIMPPTLQGSEAVRPSSVGAHSKTKTRSESRTATPESKNKKLSRKELKEEYVKHIQLVKAKCPPEWNSSVPRKRSADGRFKKRCYCPHCSTDLWSKLPKFDPALFRVESSEEGIRQPMKVFCDVHSLSVEVVRRFEEMHLNTDSLARVHTVIDEFKEAMKPFMQSPLPEMSAVDSPPYPDLQALGEALNALCFNNVLEGVEYRWDNANSTRIGFTKMNEHVAQVTLAPGRSLWGRRSMSKEFKDMYVEHGENSVEFRLKRVLEVLLHEQIHATLVMYTCRGRRRRRELHATFDDLKLCSFLHDYTLDFYGRILYKGLSTPATCVKFHGLVFQMLAKRLEKIVSPLLGFEKRLAVSGSTLGLMCEDIPIAVGRCAMEQMPSEQRMKLYVARENQKYFQWVDKTDQAKIDGLIRYQNGKDTEADRKARKAELEARIIKRRKMDEHPMCEEENKSEAHNGANSDALSLVTEPSKVHIVSLEVEETGSE